MDFGVSLLLFCAFCMSAALFTVAARRRKRPALTTTAAVLGMLALAALVLTLLALKNM